MHQKRQDIIPGCKGRHIIAESSGINLDIPTCQHFYYRIFQSIHINLNVNF